MTAARRSRPRPQMLAAAGAGALGGVVAATIAGGALAGAGALFVAGVGGLLVAILLRTIAAGDRARAHLRARERRLTALVEDTADGLVVLGADGRATVVSPFVERILGLAPAEVTRTPWEELVHPDDRPMFLRETAHITRSAGASTNLELRLRAGEGSYRWVAGRAVNLRDHPDVRGVVVVFQDIGREKAAAAQERVQLSRDLHDSVSQALFSLTLQARAAQIALDREGLGPDSPATTAVGDVADLARGALAEVHALIFELRPRALEEEGFVSALRKHAAAHASRHRIVVEVAAPEQRIALPARTEEHLFRVVLEAVGNATRHADATTVRVEVAAHDGDPPTVTVHVRDDGRGFDPEAGHPGHFGLKTMTERVGVLGGALSIASSPGAGSVVSVSVPVKDLV